MANKKFFRHDLGTPGTAEAILKGCTCPDKQPNKAWKWATVEDPWQETRQPARKGQQDGKKIRGLQKTFNINPDCPLHTKEGAGWWDREFERAERHPGKYKYKNGLPVLKKKG